MIDIDSYKRELLIKECSEQTKEYGIVLDAGAGECQYKELFKNKHYISIDLTVGDQNWNYKNISVVANLERIPFKNNTFDSILCIQVLEHVKEPQIVINELYRVLKDNGYIYLSVPQGWSVHQAPFDYYRYTNYGIQYILEKAKFKVDYIRPTTGYFGYLANRLLFFPKIIFFNIKNNLLRISLLPLEIFIYILLIFILVPILNAIDKFDKEKNFTLNYRNRPIFPP